MGSLNTQAYPVAGYPNDKNDFGWMVRIASSVDRLIQGKTNNTGSTTLRSGAVSTTVSDVRCAPNSVITFMPTSATGAAAFAQWSIRTITEGAFTITHISTSTADATAKYVITGG